MLLNEKFGKLNEDNTIQYAPLNIQIGNTWYCPASDSMLKKAGYKIIIDTPYPTDGKEYDIVWKETQNSIKKSWVEFEPDEIVVGNSREKAYQADLVCKYKNNTYTIDDMNRICLYYLAEGDEEKVEEIRKIISKAKNKIRKKYSD